jgi:hypothetical protein
MYHPHVNQIASRVMVERRRQADLLNRSERHGVESVNRFSALGERIRIVLNSWFYKMGRGQLPSESLTTDCLTVDC